MAGMYHDILYVVLAMWLKTFVSRLKNIFYLIFGKTPVLLRQNPALFVKTVWLHKYAIDASTTGIANNSVMT
jgi:hypothetical protein